MIMVQILLDEWIDWDNGERVVKVILYEREVVSPEQMAEEMEVLKAKEMI